MNVPQLIKSTMSMNKEERESATSQLQYLEHEHFAKYVLELCRILGSSSESSQVRQSAGLILKNCIGGGRSNEYLTRIKKRWSMQHIDLRNELKTAVLSVLGLPDIDARNTAVNIISNLALIESLNEWKELIPILINKCLSKNNDLMYSSLKCIGQIAESSLSHSDLIGYSPKILECIAHGMSIQDTNNNNNNNNNNNA